MNRSPRNDATVRVEGPRGCGCLAVLMLLAVGSFVMWRNQGDLLPRASEAFAAVLQEFRDLDDSFEPSVPSDGEADGALKRATLDSGQVIVGDFQIRTIEEIWSEGDVVGAMNVAIEKDPAWLRRLIGEEGIDPNLELLYQSGSGWAHPLEKAVRQGSQETFEILLAAGSDPNGRSSDGQTALHVAARKGFGQAIAQLLDAGADPNLLSEGGGAAIELAASYGNHEELEMLIAAGAEIRFSLHSAASGGHVEIIQRLLDLGADPKQLTAYGDSTLRGAAKDEYLQATELLLAVGARPGEQSLREAARGGHLETLRAYGEAGVRFDVPPAYWDALYSASHAGRTDAVRLLLELGASPHAGANLDGPIDIAIAEGHDEVTSVLAAAGAKPSPEATAERP